MSEAKYDHLQRPTIAIGVGNQLAPWWPCDIIEPYLNQPTNSPTLIIANLRGCCANTIEYLQAQMSAREEHCRTCPDATCGQRITGHIPEAELRTAFRAHRAMFPVEWGPRTLVESVGGGWNGVGRGQPGSGAVAAAQSAFIIAGGISSVETAVAATQAAYQLALDTNPLTVGGSAPSVGAVAGVFTHSSEQQQQLSSLGTADSPSMKPTLSEWNSLDKLVKMCSKLQWQRTVTIAYEYIETLEEQLDTIAVPPTSYVYFLNMV